MLRAQVRLPDGGEYEMDVTQTRHPLLQCRIRVHLLYLVLRQVSVILLAVDTIAIRGDIANHLMITLNDCNECAIK